jgi:hypothetical protein
MLLRREDLKGEYIWIDGIDQNLFTGELTRRKFDRNNGDQILFLINLYGSNFKDFSIEDGLKIEELLLEHLPLEAKSEISVFNWLKEYHERTRTI